MAETLWAGFVTKAAQKTTEVPVNQNLVVHAVAAVRGKILVTEHLCQDIILAQVLYQAYKLGK